MLLKPACVCVIINDVSLFMPTGYSARHVGREVDRHFLLRLLLLFLFLLLTLREAALLVQPKAVISCKALQEPTYCVTLGLNEKQDMTPVSDIKKQEIESFQYTYAQINQP